MNLKTSGIYKITNIITSNFYIGKSKNIQQRWYQHRSSYKKVLYNSLYVDMQTYGIENFKIEIVEECKEEELTKREHYYIYTLNPYYNDTTGIDYSISNSKLSEVEVIRIQVALIKGEKIKDLASEYMLSVNTISNINTGKSWHNSSFVYPLKNTEKNYPEGFLDYIVRTHHAYDLDTIF